MEMFERICLSPEVTEEFGLAPGEFDGLGRVVILTGPNGAGKTRLLGALARQLQVVREKYLSLAKQLSAQPQLLDDLARGLDFERASPELEAAGVGAFLIVVFGLMFGAEPEDPRLRQAVSWLRERADAGLERRLSDLHALVGVRGGLNGALATRAWPRVISLADKKVHNRRWDDGGSVEVDLNQRYNDYFKQAATLIGMSRIPGWEPSDEGALERAQSFRRTASALMGLKLGERSRGAEILPTFGDRAVTDREELSPGQRRLLRWAELIHEEVTGIEDAILLIDEPETHLHPAALVDVLRRLNSLGPSQIWIATHSLPVLSLPISRCVFYVNGGSWRPMRAQMDAALGGLLGPERGVERIVRFLAESRELGFHHFVATALSGDLGGFNSSELGLESEAKEGELTPVRVLEYATGRSTVLASLWASRARLSCALVDGYVDRSDEEGEALERVLERINGEGSLPGYYRSVSAISAKGKREFDLFIANDLGRAQQPGTWVRLFGDLAELIDEQGTLVFLSTGTSFQRGLPLGHGELSELFTISAQEWQRECASGRGSEAGQSWAKIPAYFLSRVDNESVAKMLERVRREAIDGLADLETGSFESEYLRGVEFGRLATRLAAAELALGSLGRDA